MNDRKYYKDAYTTTFSAAVREQLIHDGNPALILDQTYFYPTSGGQPHDLGKINDIPVLDVLVRPEDEAILHILEKELAAITFRELSIGLVVSIICSTIQVSISFRRPLSALPARRLSAST